MKKKYLRLFIIICAAALILSPFSSALAAGKIVKTGDTWTVTKTTRLTTLTIAKDASIEAPEDHTVTLTVDGIGTAIAAGTYKGDVVLTVNEAIDMGSAAGGGGGMPEGGMPDGAGGPPGGGDMGAGGPPMDAPGGGMPSGDMPTLPGGEAMPQGGSDMFRAAVYVEDGKYVPEKSVAAMVTEGSVGDKSARDVKIASTEGKFNGIIVTGDTRSIYTIENPDITLAGNGGDDASGLGHGIMASGHAEVFIENARINNTGANRSAVFVSGDGVVHVNNSEIECHNGPRDDTSSVFATGGGIMAAGPWLLGITGNCRATNVVERGTAYYTDTHIKSQAWGALSTDGPEKIRLTATRCLVETVESGYGVYSIGNCINTYSDCIFNVVDYGIILCDNSTDIVTDGTVINSKRIGVMMHTGSGSGALIIDKGSVFNTRDTVIQVKGRGIDILVDDAALNTESGMILHSMANDDPFFAAGMGDTMGEQGFSKDVNAVFRNTRLDGDILNSYTAVSPVNVTFENASITGAITTGTTEQPKGPNGEELSLQTSDLYYLIGQTLNTYCARFEDPYGVSVSLDEDSSWVVDETSYLTRLSIAQTGSVSAPEGKTLTMTVNGTATPLKAGTYEGDIVLAVK